MAPGPAPAAAHINPLTLTGSYCHPIHSAGNAGEGRGEGFPPGRLPASPGEDFNEKRAQTSLACGPVRGARGQGGGVDLHPGPEPMWQDLGTEPRAPSLRFRTNACPRCPRGAEMGDTQMTLRLFCSGQVLSWFILLGMVGSGGAPRPSGWTLWVWNPAEFFCPHLPRGGRQTAWISDLRKGCCLISLHRRRAAAWHQLVQGGGTPPLLFWDPQPTSLASCKHLTLPSLLEAPHLLEPATVTALGSGGGGASLSTEAECGRCQLCAPSGLVFEGLQLADLSARPIGTESPPTPPPAQQCFQSLVSRCNLCTQVQSQPPLASCVSPEGCGDSCSSRGHCTDECSGTVHQTTSTASPPRLPGP